MQYTAGHCFNFMLSLEFYIVDRTGQQVEQTTITGFPPSRHESIPQAVLSPTDQADET
jgi:hypothetical protein